MNLDDAWHAIDEQRLTVAALLEELNDQEWTQPSLCEGWTVRDVAAHLTLQQIGPGQALAQIVRHPGGMNRMIHNAVCRRAGRRTDRRDVEGRIEAVLLLLTGRLVVLPRLSGDGIAELRARLAPASR
jgi:hypothetical protein